MPLCPCALYRRARQALLVTFLAIVVSASSFPPAGHVLAAEIPSADWAVASGHFFTQTGETGRGFLVSDEQGIPFLSELKVRGGITAIGYPISARFEWKGFTVQAFQKAVLQWMPGEKRVAFINIFDDLGGAGLDPWLRNVRSTPGHAWLANEDKMQWDAIVKARQELLVVNQGIRARYFAVPDPITLYGLPSSYVEDMGNHYAVRLQRAVIQQWKVDVPWAAAGETTVANGGDIAKEAGLFPANALQPTGPNGVTATRTATAVRTTVAITSATPTPINPVANATPTIAWNVTPLPIPFVNPGASTVSATATAVPIAGQVTPIGTGTPGVSPTLTSTPTPTPTRVSPFRVAPLAAIPPPGQAKRVIIDPGHGGNQVGSSAVFSDGTRLFEKHLTLEIARRTATLLRQAGYQVALTRDADVQAGGPNLPDDLQARLDLANNFKADVFISIHHNGISNRDIKGFEIYYALDRPFSTDNKALADVLFQQIGRQMYVTGYDPLARGVIPDTSGADPEHFFLLSPESKKVKRPGLMPTALIESLFLTNAEDAAALRRPEIREAIARGAAVAVGTFLTGRKPTF